MPDATGSEGNDHDLHPVSNEYSRRTTQQRNHLLNRDDVYNNLSYTPLSPVYPEFTSNDDFIIFRQNQRDNHHADDDIEHTYGCCTDRCDYVSTERDTHEMTVTCWSQTMSFYKHCFWFRQNNWTVVNLLMSWLLIMAFVLPFSNASCVQGVKELWAYTNPEIEIFQDVFQGKYVSSKKGSVCRWLLQSTDDDIRVELWFQPFILYPGVGDDIEDETADCLEIYDGPHAKSPILDKVCNSKPKREYISKSRFMYMVYRRGSIKGHRMVTFHFKAKNPDNTSNLIKIAGIVIGCLAAIGVGFLLLKHTKCCGFLCKDKNNNSTVNETNPADGTALNLSPNHSERDRLTPIVVTDDLEITGTHSNNNNNNLNNNNNNNYNNSLFVSPLYVNGRHNSHNRVGSHSNSSSNPIVIVHADDQVCSNSRLNVGVGSAASASSDSNGDLNLDLDSESGDSLPAENEPPPSYDSLYLNEDGIQPPEYSPPKHRSTNPPRRVHTFN